LAEKLRPPIIEKKSDLDPLLSRSRSLEYLNIQGLCAITGCQKESFDSWILKELIDNALDACDADKVKPPRIDVKITRIDNIVNICVQDNGPGLSRENLEKILDFSRFSSSKYYQKKPQRGYMGNALKAIIGIPFAFAKLHGHVPHVKVISNGFCHTIRLKVIQSDNVTVNIESKETEVNGTTVQVFLPALNKYWGWNKHYLDLIKSYSIFNPAVSFTISLQREQEHITRSYPGEESPLKTFKGKPSIHWCTVEELRRYILALEETTSISVDQFISSFFGFSTKARREEILNPINITPETDLSEISQDKVDQIYDAMVSSRKPPKPEQLTQIGEKQLLSKITIAYSEPLKYKYKFTATDYLIDGVSYPSKIEVLIAAIDMNTLSERRVVVGINQTPTLNNPLRNTIFTGSKKKNSIRHGVHAFLDSLNIKEKDPVLVLIHISTPNPSYENYGKTQLNIQPFLKPLTQAIETASSFYYGYKRGNKKVGEKSEARKHLIQELLRRVELLKVQGYIPDNQMVTMQTLYYQIRKKMGGDIKIQRKSLIAAIKPECEALGYKRLQLGIITTVRAELHFRGKDYPISHDNLDMLAELGSDIIIVEKEGISLALSKWADKYGVALLTSRGFLVEYAQELVELMREKKGNLYLLTDFDAAGISISTKVPMVPRIGVDFDTRSELGLEYESVVEKYIPKKNVLRDVPSKFLWFLSQSRIEIDSILSEAGPELFWQHLMKKMVEISPQRDLTRSISLDVRLPEEAQKFLSEIERYLTEPADQLKIEHWGTLVKWSEGLVPLEEIESRIQCELTDKIRASDSFKVAMGYFETLESVLRSLKKTEK